MRILKAFMLLLTLSLFQPFYLESQPKIIGIQHIEKDKPVKKKDIHKRRQHRKAKKKKDKVQEKQKPSRQKKVHNITLGIIKPDAVKHNNSGDIIRIIELNDFEIVGMKKILLTKKQAKEFYKEHKGKPFFKDLISYITSGPIIALALEKKDAVDQWRTLMGPTNPKQAQPGTLRKMFGTSLTENAVHGSDSAESARRELKFFF